MNLRRWIFAALLLAVLPAHAAGPLKRTQKFDANSRDALVIVGVTPQKFVDDWYLYINEYSLESKRFVGSIYRGFRILQHVDGQQKSPRFLATIVKRAGTHIVYGLGTQALWGACFDKGTQAFTFEPGKVYYLGIVDPNESLHRIGTELPSQSRSTPYWVEGMWLSYTPPAQQKGWEQDVAAFIAESLPNVKAPVLAANGTEVSFTPGKAKGGNQICRDFN